MGLCLGTYGDPMGWVFSYERGTPAVSYERGTPVQLLYKNGVYEKDLIHALLCSEKPRQLYGCDNVLHVRLIDSCITQLKAQGPFRTCNASKEEPFRTCNESKEAEEDNVSIISLSAGFMG